MNTRLRAQFVFAQLAQDNHSLSIWTVRTLTRTRQATMWADFEVEYEDLCDTHSLEDWGCAGTSRRHHFGTPILPTHLIQSPSAAKFKNIPVLGEGYYKHWMPKRKRVRGWWSWIWAAGSHASYMFTGLWWADPLSHDMSGSYGSGWERCIEVH